MPRIGSILAIRPLQIPEDTTIDTRIELTV